MAQFLRWLKSTVIAPKHLAVLGSLFDFAGPQISQKFRRILFRLFGGMLAGTFYADCTEMPRLKTVLGGLVACILYRLKIYGLENLPEEGCLLLANHITHFDAVVLQLACPRPIRFITLEGVGKHPWVTPLLKLVGADFIAVSKTRSKEAVREAVQGIKKGEIVCIFPEGEMSQTGVLLKLQSGFKLIAQLAECAVLPIWLDGLFGSVPFECDKYLFKLPKRLPLTATIAFGEPIPVRMAENGFVRQKLVELGELCFRNRSEIRYHLGRASVCGLKRRRSDDAIIDEQNGQRLKRGDLLAASIALSRCIKRHCTGQRVAILLSPGADAFVANIAVTLAGKVPANLDFNAGRAALRAAIDRGEITHAISSSSMMERLGDFPWPKEVYQLEELMQKLKPKIEFWRIVSFLMPARPLTDLLGLPRKSDRKEAFLFFTCDRSGEAKTIVSSDRNVMSSVVQLGSMLRMERQPSLMATPWLEHNFGWTVNLWYSVIEGCRTVICPNGANVATNAELIERYAITFLMTTPDLVQDYLERADASQFANVKLVITGPEPSPSELSEAFERKFGKPVFDGYWLTETGTLVSANLPEPAENPYNHFQPCSRAGSVGKLMPGQAAQIRDPETGEILSPFDLGMLWLKGPNIFEGYLNKPEKTSEVLHNAWFQTGELARFDEDGFLYLEGRLSRFPSATRVNCAEDRPTACSG